MHATALIIWFTSLFWSTDSSAGHLVCCCSLAHSTQQLYTVAVDDVVAQAAAAATTVAADDSQSGGTFGFLADGFEAFLKVCGHTCDPWLRHT
jgi:hypothetical protein